jgi:hypothetical protein
MTKELREQVAKSAAKFAEQVSPQGRQGSPKPNAGLAAHAAAPPRPERHTRRWQRATRPCLRRGHATGHVAVHRAAFPRVSAARSLGHRSSAGACHIHRLCAGEGGDPARAQRRARRSKGPYGL